MNFSFVDKCLNKETSIECIDEWVEAWHNGDGSTQELHEYLGMTWEEYSKWCITHSMLAEIISSRLNNGSN